MRRSTKTSEVLYLDFSDFSGGLNLLTSQELLADNEMAQCVNMTYSTTPGRLCTRWGLGSPVLKNSKIHRLEPFGERGVWVASDQLDWVVVAEPFGSPPTVRPTGKLSDSSTFAVESFGGDLFIASGNGAVQKTLEDGTKALETVAGTSMGWGLYARAGRLFRWSYGGEVIAGSAVGDGNRWAIPPNRTDADPVEIYPGHKTAGRIRAVLPGLRDVLIFKDRGIFRLVGEFPHWSVEEVTRDVDFNSRYGVAESGGVVYWYDRSRGLRALTGTAGYEQMTVVDALPKINPAIRRDLRPFQVRLRDLPAHNALALWAAGGRQVYVISRQGSGLATLLWHFPESITDLAELGNGTLAVATPQGLYHMRPENCTEMTDGASLPVTCKMTTRRVVAPGELLLKRVFVDARARQKFPSSVPFQLLVNGKPYTQTLFYRTEANGVHNNGDSVYGNGESVFGGAKLFERQEFATHQLLRGKALTFEIVGGGTPVELSRMTAEAVVVGVHA